MKTEKFLFSRGALWLCGLLFFTEGTVQAQDSFGSGANAFTIEFSDIGNPGNPNDTGGGGGIHSSPYGGVAYNYRISKYAISQNDVLKATASGLSNVSSGPHSGDQPATTVTWYEAAAFVNWLNESAGYQKAYDLSYSSGWSMNEWGLSDQSSMGVDAGTNAYRHKDTYYFLPSEDEFYKAAFHQNDGVTGNYWDYATGSNTVPTAVSGGTSPGTAVYDQPNANGPADVFNAGGLSSYGTMGQVGNTVEWYESNWSGPNDLTNITRGARPGYWYGPASNLTSAIRGNGSDTLENSLFGFRVASIPEPSTILMVVLTGLAVGITPLYRRLRRRNGRG